MIGEAQGRRQKAEDRALPEPAGGLQAPGPPVWMAGGWGWGGGREREKMGVGIGADAAPREARGAHRPRFRPPTRQRQERFCAIKASRKTAPGAFWSLCVCLPLPGEPGRWNDGAVELPAQAGCIDGPIIPTTHAAQPPALPRPTVLAHAQPPHRSLIPTDPDGVSKGAQPLWPPEALFLSSPASTRKSNSPSPPPRPLCVG